MMAFKEKDLKLAEMSTDFPTQEERIAARRLRIQNKQQESERYTIFYLSD